MTDAVPRPARAGPTRADWARFAMLVGLWGTAFALVKTALADSSPAYVTLVRLWVSAAVLNAWALMQGVSLRRLIIRPIRIWGWLGVLGLLGAAYPFTAIAVGQLNATSALAGILIATMPIATVALTQVFVREDRLTPRKAIGVAVGFLGVVLLIGPAALADLGGPAMWAQLVIVSGSLAYAATAIVAFRAPEMDATETAAGMMLAAAIWATPLGLWDVARAHVMTPGGLIAAGVLGVGASGFATIIYLQLVRSAGPSFTALTNYVVPITAIIVGVVALGETLDVRSVIAFAVILAGVHLAARSRGA